VQVLSGSCSASFDKKRFPRRASASGQQVVLLTIDTACQGLHGAQGAADCLASGDLIGRFHLNIIDAASSVHPARKINRPLSVPRVHGADFSYLHFAAGRR